MNLWIENRKVLEYLEWWIFCLVEDYWKPPALEPSSYSCKVLLSIVASGSGADKAGTNYDKPRVAGAFRPRMV